MASVSLVFCCKKIQVFFKKGLTSWLQCGIIVVTIATRKELEMGKHKVKIHISLAKEIYEMGKDMAEQMGIPFSTLISILISNETIKKTKK